MTKGNRGVWVGFSFTTVEQAESSQHSERGWSCLFRLDLSVSFPSALGRLTAENNYSLL